MILLTSLDIRYQEPIDVNIVSEGEIFAIDPWAVITVEKFKSYKGEEIGSKVFLGEGRGFVTVRELMVDIIQQVEAEVNPEKLSGLTESRR